MKLVSNIPPFCRILCFFRLHCIFEGFVSLNRILENYWILTRGPWVPLLTLETLSPLNTQENFEPSLVEIGPVSGSGEEDFDKFDNVFLLFCYYLPLQKGMTLNSFEQSWISLYQTLVCAKFVWNCSGSSVGPVVLEKKGF